MRTALCDAQKNQLFQRRLESRIRLTEALALVDNLCALQRPQAIKTADACRHTQVPTGHEVGD